MSASNVRASVLVVIGAALLGGGSARAEDAGLAQEMFERGRQSMANEDYRRARTQFEMSYHAEPALGALLNLAVCEEKLGLWKDALKHLDQGLQVSDAQDRRRPSVAARFDELRARIPHLVVRSRAPLAPSVAVTLDAVAIDAGSLGASLPVDPGPHTLRCEGERGALCSHEFEAHEGESIEWWIDLDSKPVAAPVLAVQPSPPVLRVATLDRTRHGPSALALWTGGVGLASLALGLVAGAEVLHAKSTMATHCDPTGCDGEGVSAAASGKAWSWVSTLATGAGALGLGTAVVIALYPRSTPGPSAEVAIHGSF